MLLCPLKCSTVLTMAGLPERVMTSRVLDLRRSAISLSMSCLGMSCSGGVRVG